MHTITLTKNLKAPMDKMYIAAIAKAMGIDLPNKIKVTSPNFDSVYAISSFDIDGVKRERIGS